MSAQPANNTRLSQSRDITIRQDGKSLYVTPSVPYSQEAEDATLGAILTSAKAYYAVAVFLKDDSFFILRNRIVWQAIQRVVEHNKGLADSIDLLTVTQELRDMGKLSDIGGMAYLTQLVNNTPNSTHAEVYGRLIERAAVRRQMLEASDKVRQLAMDENLPLEDIVLQTQEQLIGVVSGLQDHYVAPVSQSVQSYTERVTRLHDQYIQTGSTSKSIGVPTGFRELDEHIGGLRKKRVYIVGAETGTGKTSFCLSMALNSARKGQRVWYIPLESDEDEYTERLISIESGISRQKLRSGEMSATEFEKYCAAADNVSKLHIHWHKRSQKKTFTPHDLLVQGMSIKYTHGLDLIVVDYVDPHTINSGNPSHKNDYDSMTTVYREICNIAEKMNVPVVVAAQINMKQMNNRASSNRRPALGDLMYTGEKDADCVLFLHRDKTNVSKGDDNKTELIVAKNRGNDWLGTINLAYANGGYKDFTPATGYQYGKDNQDSREWRPSMKMIPQPPQTWLDRAAQVQF